MSAPAPTYEDLVREVGDDPHELSSAIDDSGLPAADRVDLYFQAFEAKPSYALLMYLGSEHYDADPELSARIYRQYASYLAGEEEEPAEQVAYALWCDYFERDDRVDQAWRALVSVGSPPRLLRRILSAVGPVPWRLKAPLIRSILPQKQWHPFLFEALFASRFDYFGQIDGADALRLLGALKVNREERFQKLETALRPEL